jgi:malate dehydrogenase (oxaloacetate-decarboxylating)
MLGKVASAIGDAGGGHRRRRPGRDHPRSDRARYHGVKARDSVHAQQVVSRLRKVPGVHIGAISDRTFLMHLGGKIEVANKVAHPNP